MFELYNFKGWRLEINPWPSYINGVPWWSVRLMRETGRGRFYLGWNGKRFARSSVLHQALNKDFEAVEWAKEILIARVPRPSI